MRQCKRRVRVRGEIKFMDNKIIKVQISGITCQACVKLITKRLSAIDGVNNVEADISGLTTIYGQKAVDIAKMQEVLKDTDYKVTCIT